MQKFIGILHQCNGSRGDCAVKQGEASVWESKFTK